jgi:hypothetical protein
MERWLLIVETNCSDPRKEKEFNRWYDTVQVPHMLETPGIMRATRYENVSPGEGQGKFITVYEIRTDDIGKTMAIEWDNRIKLEKQGRVSALSVLVSARLCRQIAAPVGKKR